MKEYIELVKVEMQVAEQECPDKVIVPSKKVQELREKLHFEECVFELGKAFEDEDKVALLDSICDSLIVVLGTAIACGFSVEQVEAAFREIHRSNMSKFIGGVLRRPDGKYLKGPHYTPANLQPILDNVNI